MDPLSFQTEEKAQEMIEKLDYIYFFVNFARIPDLL